jgi:hypothetical protein
LRRIGARLPPPLRRANDVIRGLIVQIVRSFIPSPPQQFAKVFFFLFFPFFILC